MTLNRFPLFFALSLAFVGLAEVSSATEAEKGFTLGLTAPAWTINRYPSGVMGVDFTATPMRESPLSYVTYTIERYPDTATLERICDTNERVLKTVANIPVRSEILKWEGSRFCHLDYGEKPQEQFLFQANGRYVAINLFYVNPSRKQGVRGLATIGLRRNRR